MGWVVLLNCGSTTPLFVGWAVPLIQMSNQMFLSPVSKLGVWFNFSFWSCSIKLWVDHSTVCGVGCSIKLWFNHPIVCGVPLIQMPNQMLLSPVSKLINSDVKSDVFVAGFKARRMVQLFILELLH